jgi:hypothetical protein
MVTRAPLLLSALALAAAAPARADDAPAPGPAAAPVIRHVPLASAPADEPLEVTAEIQGAHLLTDAAIHYRHRGEGKWHDAPFARSGKGFSATIPAADMGAGVLEYYVSSRRAGGAEQLHFASPDAPHPLPVLGDPEQRWRKELLAAHLGNHSRFQARYEFVHFGVRELADGTPFHDYYWRAEGDYTYRILGWIYSIRLGAGVIRGETYTDNYFDGGRKAAPRVGLSYGFAETRFRLGPLVRVDLSVKLGVGPNNFDGGGGAQLLIGRDPGTHFAVGGEYVTDVGGRAYLRLAWNTVPRLPMSLTLETTNLPNLNQISGRVYFGAAFRFNRYLSIDATVGYGTRDFRLGGPSAGLGVALEF